MMDFNLYFYKANLIDIYDIYDGDTIRLDIDLGFNQWMLNKSCRLYGIDTPEVRGESKERGLFARDYLRELLRNHMQSDSLIIKSHKDSTDKYGRLLVTLYMKSDLEDDWIDVNQLLLDKGLAKIYGS